MMKVQGQRSEVRGQRSEVKGQRSKVKGALVLSLLSAVLGFVLAGCTTAPDEDPGTVNVLMIGNSFSISCLAHLPQVAAQGGVKLDLASLYIGGCSLKRHWENATNDVNESFRPYRFDRVVEGRRIVDNGKANVCEALRMAKWDIVTVQQASHESWQTKSYSPYGEQLVAKIRELAPQAKIYVQETWSYTPWDKRLAKWNIDQNEMYDALHAAYGSFAKQQELQVIPFGTAVQEWRKRLPVKYTENSFGGDVVGGGKQDERDHFKRNKDNKWVPNCDVFHLGRKGEYFQALVWAKTLLGVDLGRMDYRPDYITESDVKLMKDIAMSMK